MGYSERLGFLYRIRRAQCWIVAVQMLALVGCWSSGEELEAERPGSAVQEIPLAVTPNHFEGSANARSGLRLAGVMAIVALSASMLVASGTILFLLRWRRIERGGQLSLVPVQLLERFAEQEQSLAEFAKAVSQHLSVSKANSERAQRSAGDQLEAFTSLQKALDERDGEIRRFRSGYDAEVFRRFLPRFLRVYRALDEEIEESTSDETRSTLLAIHALQADALEECGVDSFTPEVGESVRSAFGVEDGYKTIPTSVEEQHLTIAEVTKPGMRLRTPAGGECLIPARICVYVYSGTRSEIDG